MKTIALYSDDNGGAQQCVIEHDANLNLGDCDLESALPSYNSGGTLFLIDLSELASCSGPEVVDVEQLTVVDQDGEAATLHSINLI
jgi:hypothetical protein